MPWWSHRIVGEKWSNLRTYHILLPNHHRFPTPGADWPLNSLWTAHAKPVWPGPFDEQIRVSWHGSESKVSGPIDSEDHWSIPRSPDFGGFHVLFFSRRGGEKRPKVRAWCEHTCCLMFCTYIYICINLKGVSQSVILCKVFQSFIVKSYISGHSQEKQVSSCTESPPSSELFSVQKASRLKRCILEICLFHCNLSAHFRG